MDDNNEKSSVIYPDNKGGYFRLDDKKGVYYHAYQTDEKGVWLCAKLKVIATTSSKDGNDWGVLVKFNDPNGNEKEWVIPLASLQGDGANIRAILADQGFKIAQTLQARRLFNEYLSMHNRTPHIITTDKIGWHDDSYVLPHTSINADNSLAVKFKGNPHTAPLKQLGTLEQWIKHIATPARGNSRLLFALSLALAAPLIPLAGLSTSVGFHLRGESRSGKTTTAKIALSVYGNYSQLMKTWHNTANALEGNMNAFNHSLLVLDELNMIDEHKLFNVIYAIGNGQMKGRSTISGDNRPAKSWNLLYLSTGEESLRDVLARAKNKPNAGQELRFMDLDSDAGKGAGAFDRLPAGIDSGQFAEQLEKNAGAYYGAVGFEWLTYLVKHKEHTTKRILDGIEAFKKTVLTSKHTSQHRSAARYFGLIAIAGEIATEQGLTGWDMCEASDASHAMFDNWVGNFGTENKEQTNIINHVRKFIELHGSSRFDDIYNDGNERIINRVGFVRNSDTGDQLEYLFTPETFRSELLAGFNLKTAINALKAAGMLIPDKAGKSQQRVTLPELGRPRVYVIRYADTPDDNDD